VPDCRQAGSWRVASAGEEIQRMSSGRAPDLRRRGSGINWKKNPSFPLPVNRQLAREDVPLQAFNQQSIRSPPSVIRDLKFRNPQ
jgi:hypothetical protein